MGWSETKTLRNTVKLFVVNGGVHCLWLRLGLCGAREPPNEKAETPPHEN